MPKKLNDNRSFKSMTIEDADKIMQRIAELTLLIEKNVANQEVKISEIKADTILKNTLLVDELTKLENLLTNYINCNPQCFVKPLSRKTNFGSYGLRTVSKLAIKDEALLFSYIKIHELNELYTVTEKLDKKAVEKAIKEKTLPKCCGAKIVTGEIANYTVSKAFITQNMEPEK